MTLPKPSASLAQQKHSKNGLAQNWALSSPSLAQLKHGKNGSAPFIHTLENITLFFEVDEHCRNECPPGTERILFTFCAKAFIVVTLTSIPSIAEVLSGIKSTNSSWAVSDAISRSRKHGATIFFHLSKLN